MSRIAKELAALATMSPAQLKARWVEIEGPVSPALPPQLVRRLLAQRLQERRFGGLSATVVREAVSNYLEESRKEGFEKYFGLWERCGSTVDGLEYERELRAEWPDVGEIAPLKKKRSAA